MQTQDMLLPENISYAPWLFAINSCQLQSVSVNASTQPFSQIWGGSSVTKRPSILSFIIFTSPKWLWGKGSGTGLKGYGCSFKIQSVTMIFFCSKVIFSSFLVCMPWESGPQKERIVYFCKVIKKYEWPQSEPAYRYSWNNVLFFFLFRWMSSSLKRFLFKKYLRFELVMTVRVLDLVGFWIRWSWVK